MIGVDEYSPAAIGGKTGGYRLRSVEDSAGAADSRQASCEALAEVLNQKGGGRVSEPAATYGLRRRIGLPQVDEETNLDRDITKLGVWISYLENKYDLTS